MKFLLDTCAVIFAVLDPSRLSQQTRRGLTQPENELYVSAISVAELACAVQRNRLRLDRHWRNWFRHFVQLNGWTVLPLAWETLEEAYSLPEPIHSDPVDRILIAHSRLEKLTIVTTDRLILDYPHIQSAS